MNLFLIVKKKYFDQINSGEKTEEFRLDPSIIVKKNGKPFNINNQKPN